ncbi:MAG TPA: DMT family transporter [Pseudonocardia sp.]|jgi:drug/metabolite transporter (DMT)-like permease|nr:DMT family transporter [Pseudonocardia sp.]
MTDTTGTKGTSDPVGVLDTAAPDGRPVWSVRRGFDAVLAPMFVLLWSSAFVVAVIGVGAAPPLLLTFSRFAVAAVLLTGMALLTRARWPRGRQLGHVAASGLLVQALQFGATYVAIGTGLPGGVVALVQGLNPALIALFAAPVLGERILRRQWWGFGLGGLGVLVAVADLWTHSVLGVVCAVVGLLGLSGGTVYQKRFVGDVDLLAGTAVQFLVSTPVLGVATWAFEQPRVADWPAFGAVLAWMALVNSIVVFLLLNVMLRRGEVSRVGTLFFLIPVVTAVLSWLVLGRGLSAPELVGLAMGGVGVLLAATAARTWPANRWSANRWSANRWSAGRRLGSRRPWRRPSVSGA